MLPTLLLSAQHLQKEYFPPIIQKLLKRKLDPKLRVLSESALEAKVGHPCPEDIQTLRTKFWFNYYSSQTSGLTMIDEQIVPTGVSEDEFLEYLWDQHRIYFLLLPPKNHEMELAEVLSAAHRNMLSIQKVNPVTEEGTVNFALAELQMKIFQLADMRKNGAYIQRAHLVSEDKTPRQKLPMKPNEIAESVEELLDERLQKLEAKKRGIPIDVAPIVDQKVPRGTS